MNFSKFRIVAFLFFAALSVRYSEASTQKHTAAIFGKHIYIAELNPTNTELELLRASHPQSSAEDLLQKARAKKLLSLIWPPIIENYAEKHNVEPTIGEIQSLADYMKEATSEITPEQTHLALPTKSEAENEKYYSMVKTWKLSKALHQEFGGAVISQPANPLEPVGAYQKLLEKHEQEGNFQIYDMLLRKTLYDSFIVESSRNLIPEDQVDYSTPWWQKKQ